MIRGVSLTLWTAIILTAHAIGSMSVTLSSKNHPVPEREALIQKLANSPTPDDAADAVLIHFNTHGFPAVGVEVEDHAHERHVIIDVSRFDQIWLSDGPKRTKKIATDLFQNLSGRFVNQQELDAMLASFHANPLHRVVPSLQLNETGTEVNALLKIEQSEPHRFSAGFHDQGANPLPRERFWFQAQFSDLWPRTSSLSSARITISPDPSDFYALQLNSRFFLNNGQETNFSLAYSGASQGGSPSFDAYTFQAAGHWKSKKHLVKDWTYRTQLGLSYRRTNNALEFGFGNVQGLADVFQIHAGQEWERRSSKSLTQIGTHLTLSPGGDDQGHNSLRSGARSRYALLRTHLRHRHTLADQWDLIATFGGQWSSDPLIQGDQIALGGAGGLRGLSEQFGLGDRGFISGLELLTPVIQFPRGWKVRPSFFLQGGQTDDLVDDTKTDGLSTGIGLQFGNEAQLRASIHAGWRLDQGGNELHSQLTWTF